jgi:hypothetical protein
VKIVQGISVASRRCWYSPKGSTLPSEEERPTDFVVKLQYRKSACWRQ